MIIYDLGVKSKAGRHVFNHLSKSLKAFRSDEIFHFLESSAKLLVQLNIDICLHGTM